jgi:hypothetical protein
MVFAPFLIFSPGKPEKPGTPVFMRVSGYPVSKNGTGENRGNRAISAGSRMMRLRCRLRAVPLELLVPVIDMQQPRAGAPMTPIEITPLAKGSTPRPLRIHRRTGERINMENGGEEAR